jgi:hypothetical protein
LHRGFAANVVVKDVPNIAWRLQLGSAFIPAVPLVVGIYFCPESPKWLMKKGRYVGEHDDAGLAKASTDVVGYYIDSFNSYVKLRKHPIIAARDLYYSHILFLEEKASAAGSTYFSRIQDCLTVPRIRRSTLAACTVMIAQQM